MRWTGPATGAAKSLAAVPKRELSRVAQAARTFERADERLEIAREELHEAIRAAYSAGDSVRVIAGHTKLSFTRIHQIIHGR